MSQSVDWSLIYTAREASAKLGKNDSYVRTIHSRTPEKLLQGEWKKVGRELLVTKKCIDHLENGGKQHE